MSDQDEPSSRTTECIAQLAQALLAEPRLQPELRRARRMFFGSDPVDAGGAAAAAQVPSPRNSGGRDGADEDDISIDAAEHRFAEWFLLERESEALGAVPVTIEPYASLAQDLEGSVAGLFLVESTGANVVIRDVQNQEVLELAVEGRLEPGDLLVGRLYPAPGECFEPSAATPALRPGRELASAFMRDLGELELDRRLLQIELEHLLLRRYGHTRVTPGLAAMEHAALADPDREAGDGAAGDHDAAGNAQSVAPLDIDETIVPGPPPRPIIPLEHLEADLEQLLNAAGDRHSATAISDQLAVAARPGAFIGPLLDQLAFDSDVDLDRARELLLEIWNCHHVKDAPPPSAPDQEGGKPGAAAEESPTTGGPPGESIGERLVRTLDQGMGEKRNVEELFAELERLAGIDPEEDEDDADEVRRATAIVAEYADAVGAGGGAANGDAGDLAPLVTEYRWEVENVEPEEDDPNDGDAGGDEAAQAADALSLWVELQRNAPVPNTDFESIESKDVMRLLLHIYLRSAPADRARSVRNAFGEIERFFAWVADTQEIDRQETLHSCRSTLLDELDRLQDAGVALGNDLVPAQAPGLLQIEELGKDGFGARDDDGGSYWVQTSIAALALLRAGDLLLGGFGPIEENAPSSLHRRLHGMVVVLPIDARSMID